LKEGQVPSEQNALSKSNSIIHYLRNAFFE